MRLLTTLMATSAMVCGVAPAYAQTDPGQQAPVVSSTPPTSPTAPGQTGVDASTTSVMHTATGDQAPDNANASTQQIGDIVVTANRVASSAQKTPTALTVYSGADLAAAGVTSVANLARVDPSVNFTARNGGGYIAVRGIASTDVTEIGDPSVPIARDGFFTNRSFSIPTSMYDLQRVEVLKGPQGTLFGRNSTGGLISLVTRRPGKELGGNFALEGGNYGTVNAEAGVDIPVGDRLQLRFSGIAHRHDGYRVLTGIGGRGDDDQTTSGRFTAAFQPFDGFEGVVQYQHDNVNDVGDVATISPVGQVLPTSFNEKRFPNYAPTTNKVTGNRIHWEFTSSNLPLGASLTYSGGYDSSHWRHALDASGNASNPVNFIQAENPDTWNHEVRLATPQDKVVSAQVGYFHFSENNTLDSGLLERQGTYAGNYLVHFNYNVRTQSDAGFGQFSVRPTSTIRLTGGFRYTWDKKDRVGTSQLRCDIAGIPSFLYPVLGCVGTPPTLPGLGNGSIRVSKPTYLGGIDWSPTARNMVYAKYSTGYKSGGFNSNGSAPSVDYGPESVQAWEIGTKNKFLDNRLQVNLDGFYSTYKGYQASQATAVVSSGTGVFNIGSATIYGAEAQVIALLGSARLDLNATYLHSRFDKDVGLVSTTDPLTGNVVSASVAGHALPNAPDFVISGGLEDKIPLGGNGASLTPRINAKYSTSYYFDVFNYADTRQRQYATADASLTFAPASGHFEVSVFVRNLTDKAVFANAQRNFTAIPSINGYQFQAPRTYGGRFSFNF
ncbi:TonB-dependent receptor [Sphingomonas sp. BAUL-RG-20F-R05-02]|uniref:TonB-dependent receptor n=1 Tax=Sphingomonas sp. BAUL-RG-20F-R05-02 TaxID=2914830 RepID=UPI001F5A8ED2|nr:TonB-dependent receptor [Sphingomonas sp. BAUL-RG-20F-R05-02]